jgi:hypothetical protein
MLVSQYIYTACGKDRTGAFSVFSKSKDITDQESAEIREMMVYKTPSGLPYEPNEREIEELFPKKFGYFLLSSGRACLAQVCYVGRVYSDLDNRMGNYIIHAFVFDKVDNVVPYSFIEDAAFKRLLTRKEWHDDPIPNDLPRVEIPESSKMSLADKNEMISFFTEDRKNKLKLLIEAIVNSSSEKPVFFHDEHKNQKNWCKALSLCLPKAMQNSVSLCTHFTNTLIPGNLSSRVQIRVNQPESGLFNYAQEAQKGRYAFNFQQNVVPGLKPGKYAESVVKLFSKDIFEVISFVDKINTVMATYSVAINDASKLINLNKPDYSGFNNSDELVGAILTAERVGYETQSIAGHLNDKEPPLDFNAPQKLQIFAFIYKHIPASSLKTKVEIIKKVVNGAKQLDIRADEATAFRDDLHSKAPFIFADYLDYLKADGGLVNYIAQNQNSFLPHFVAFDFLVARLQVSARIFQTLKDDRSEETVAIKKIMYLAFKRQSVPDIDLLITSANAHLNDLGTELLSIIVQGDIDSTGTRSAPNIAFVFNILRRLRQKADFAGIYLLYLIKTLSNQEEFIKEYIGDQKNDSVFYTKFENENKGNQAIVDFCKKKDAYRFENQPLTLGSLREYFDKYYVTGMDTGLFVKCLREYLFSIQNERRGNECLNMLNTAKASVNINKTLLPPVYSVVLDAFFSVPYNNINALHGRLQPIFEAHKTLKNTKSPLSQDVDDLTSLSSCGEILNRSRTSDQCQTFLFSTSTQSDVDTLAKSLNTIQSRNGIDTFVNYYFKQTATILISGATCEGQFDYDGAVKKVFGKIIETGDSGRIADSIINGIKTAKVSQIPFILYIFRKHLGNSQKTVDAKLGHIAERYFEKISSGERKKLFKELQAKAKDTEATRFERYFEKFNKEHSHGIFDFLFGLFRKKDD